MVESQMALDGRRWASRSIVALCIIALLSSAFASTLSAHQTMSEVTALKSDFPIHVVNMVEHKGQILILVNFHEWLDFPIEGHECESERKNSSALVFVDVTQDTNYTVYSYCLNDNNITGIAYRGDEILMVQNEIQSEVGRRDSPTKICRMTITHFENQDDPNCSQVIGNGRPDGGIIVVDEDTTYITLKVPVSSGNTTVSIIRYRKDNTIDAPIPLFSTSDIAGVTIAKMQLLANRTKLGILLDVDTKAGGRLVFRNLNYTLGHTSVTRQVVLITLPLDNLKAVPEVSPETHRKTVQVQFLNYMYVLNAEKQDMHGFTTHYLVLQEVDLDGIVLKTSEPSVVYETPKSTSNPKPSPTPTPTPTPVVAQEPDNKNEQGEPEPIFQPDPRPVTQPQTQASPSPVVEASSPSNDAVVTEQTASSWSTFAIVFSVLCIMGYAGWKIYNSASARQYIAGFFANPRDGFASLARAARERFGSESYSRVDPDSAESGSLTSGRSRAPSSDKESRSSKSKIR